MTVMEVYAGSNGQDTLALYEPRNLEIGSKFGEWTTLEPATRVRDKILCQCSCGLARKILVMSLLRNDSRYCGKYSKHPGRRTNATKHKGCINGKETKEYRAWKHVKRRCLDPKSSAYEHYGAKGVIMFREWVESFVAFVAHIGPAPSPEHTVDRIRNSEGYVPGNVRWATWDEQRRNKTSNVWLEYKGERLIRVDWAKRVGISAKLIESRMKRGWTVERTLSTPLLKK